ncbi:hypothetical protein AVU42_gp137 [Prochlorococcus phage P-TIM68]|uniref:Uncharacterized protein n=1 Tax=Prochlorococcus phage P-TIM68 TaxID=1542477 RepID=A0A0K0KWI1_9CAUD|nr:hypothetical protein AVU42_gp137 [Prochlorococcus phage P-TIM68]AIR93474.1 hypothetical protein [Prochlorococcus phage P-TIM68]
MKKTRYYFIIKEGINRNWYLPNGGLDLNDIVIKEDWYRVKASAVEDGVILHVDEKGETFSYDDVTDLALPYDWKIEITRIEEVEIKPKTTKLPIDNKYKNGFNWKNAHIHGANSRLKKQTNKANTDAEKRSERDAQYFKTRVNKKEEKVNKPKIEILKVFKEEDISNLK